MSSSRTFRSIAAAAVLVFLVAFAPAIARVEAGGSQAAPKTVAKTPTQVDLNNASQADLEALPSVGAATAKKIIAGRPYAVVADLAKAGVSAKTITTITPLVTVGAPAAGAPKIPSASSSTTAGKNATGADKVDINTASQKDLEALKGVGPATAKKIIAARPFATVQDLSKAGLTAKTITDLTPFVTVGAASANVAPGPSAPAAAKPTTAAAGGANSTDSTGIMTVPNAKPGKVPAAGPPPVPGMVWVNTESKVFHHDGDPYYGNTKHGKYMTEADALKAGYRAAKK